MNKKQAGIIGGIAILLACGAVGGVAYWNNQAPERARQATINFFKTADSVEVVRLDSGEDSEVKPAKGDFPHYIDVKRVLWQSGTSLEKAKAAVISAMDDTDPGEKACVPMPGIAFRFHHGSQTRDVLVCFDCYMFRWDQSFGRWQNFQESGPKLLQVSLRAFPQDKDLLALKH